MELQWMVVFLILCSEMFLCLLFILPLPVSLRKLLCKLSSIAQRPQIRTALIAVFLVIAFLFVDALRSQNHLREEAHLHRDAAAQLTSVHNRLFRAQRNGYLTGFTLFLMLVLYRFQLNTLDLLAADEKLAALKKELNASTEEQRRLQERLKKGSNDGDNEKLQEVQKELAALKQENKELVASLNKVTKEKDSSSKKDD
eukprot:TRINITY_DN16466_c0_g1_i1.p1 TRINITY_DN16466_c0_g1~~TRINITY_DN16466_c0_g1_i1.p1  ORF type:complete len:199 (+),score=51.25 TRINITY_DN16466_c0_g1_i1:83-679(+)